MLRVLVSVSALAGCYEPKLMECTVVCAADVECGPGQSCRAEGYCASPDVACDRQGDLVPATIGDAAESRDAAMVLDAASVDAPPRDAPSGDAPSGCAPGCQGRCENAVCVIECTGENSCDDEVRCPAQGACEVLCAGANSCAGGVRCGNGRCTVTCSGEESCEESVDCKHACACDVYCTGEDSCGDESKCPHPWCELGDGCRAWAASCNDC